MLAAPFLSNIKTLSPRLNIDIFEDVNIDEILLFISKFLDEERISP